jgi:hypothetical protein
LVLVIVGLLTLGALAAWGLARPSQPAGPPAGTADTFLDQMQQAANGAPLETNIFGGTLRLERKSGLTLVSTDSIPPGICVSVGWKLVRKGTLTINGITPVRVSAARLADLCNQPGHPTASLIWAPRPAE